MDLFEYQARDLFAAHGVPVLDGLVATTPAEARAAAEQLLPGAGLVVVKAQVKTGGRGKAGGVKLARTPDEAEQVAAQILGMDIKGHTVHRVLVALGADIDKEYYVSLLLDCPGLAHPIRANLFRSNDSDGPLFLLWSRPSRREDRS